MTRDRRLPRLLLIPAFALVSWGCGGDTPTGPTVSTMSLTALAPQAGSAVLLPQEYAYIVPGGLVIPKDSGYVSLRVDMTSAADATYAQLNVYLLTGGTTTEYCGQNTPDSPTWGLISAGWTTSVTISGFRVYQVPCEVTGFRAVLHTRNNGLLTPPTPAETIVEAVLARSFTLER